MNGSKFMSLFKLFANKKNEKTRCFVYLFTCQWFIGNGAQTASVKPKGEFIFDRISREFMFRALNVFFFKNEKTVYICIPSNLYFFEHFDNTIKLAIIFRSVFRTDKVLLILFLLFLAIKILFQFEILRNEEKYQKENKIGRSKQNHRKWIDFVCLAIYLFVADILVVC